MLTLCNIQKSFGCSDPVLKNIHLELHSGTFCIVVGNNGSGKSTLLRSISGEHSIDAGCITISGLDMTSVPASGRAKFIASVTQDIHKGTIPEMTLLENMVLSRMRCKPSRLRFYKKHEAEIFRLVQELDVGLEEYLYLPLETLSGGQRQIVAIVMALTSNPQILLLDEHTSALAPKTCSWLMEYTAQCIVRFGITTIMVTHKLDDAVKYGSRLVMLHQGRIVFDVSGQAKKELQADKLLALFYQHV